MRICSHCCRCYDDQVEFCTESDHHVLSEKRSGNPGMIPGYRLDLLLESGLKGDLYRSHQVECGQNCTIRIVSPKKKISQQYLREAKHAAALFHPNLLDVYEAGTCGSGEMYIVSAEPDGQILREYLSSVPVPPLLTTIEIMNQTAIALHALHQEGLLHRALRPENIVLTKDAEGMSLVQLKDIDFGGVIERSIVSNKFLIDTALDSVKYFAPEQFTGGRTSVSSDVYALGIILYEMLAGAPPFDAAKASTVIEKHRHQEPKQIRIDNFDLRALLTHTLSESLQKEPVKRHASAQAFARQLRHMEQLATHVSTPPPAITAPPFPDIPILTKAASASAAKSETIQRDSEPSSPVSASMESEQEPGGPQPIPEANDPWLEAETYSAPDHRTENPYNGVASFTYIPTPTDGKEPDEYLPKHRVDRASRLARLRVRNKRSKVLERPKHNEEPSAQNPRVEEEITVPLTISSVVVEKELPVEDLPLKEIKPPPPSPAFIDPEPEEITVVTASKKPAVIEWQLSEDDIPSVDDVIEELAKVNAVPAFDIDRREEPPKASKAIEKRPKKRDEDIQFLPSLMRKSNDVSSLDIYGNYSILSGYGVAQTHFAFDYRTLVLGIGLIGLVLLFLVANSMFRQQYITSQPATPSMRSIPSQPDQTQVAEISPGKKPSKTQQKIKIDDGTPASPSTVASVKPQPKLGTDQDQFTKGSTAARAASKPSSISSTLVISTENGKLKSTVETSRRPVESKSPIATNKITGTSRPRIVGN